LSKYNALYFPISKIANSSIKAIIAKILDIELANPDKNAIHDKESSIHRTIFPSIDIKNKENINKLYKF